MGSFEASATMPPHTQLDKTTRLQLGDHVSVAVAVFGESYARERGANPWHTEAVRDEGYVIGSNGSKWLIEFDDGEFSFDRRAISLISRPRAAPERAVSSRRSAVVVSNSDEEDEGVDEPQEPVPDSSEDEDWGAGEADHEGGEIPVVMFRGVDGAWRRDDSYGFDERARHNFTDQSGPRVNNLSSWENASIFAVAEHFLPVTYLQLMAAGMQDNTRSKFYAGDRSYANFTLSYYDLLQWIGVWMYMLAFPQTGPRRAYFQEPFAWGLSSTTSPCGVASSWRER